MIYWIFLSRVKGLGPIMQKKLINHFGSPENVFLADEDEILKVEGIGKIRAKEIKMTSLEEANQILEKCDKLKIKVLCFSDYLYPNEAKSIDLFPTVLYYKGELKENLMGVGIVGSRRCSDYGKEIAREAASFLAKNNIPVISGMAKGIDSYAHTACLKSGGYTIGILGSSPDICYPREHINLMESIIENGAVISEYPPTTKALSRHFPKRNFLISSFSEKLLVAEASEKSGALITAEFSKKLNRKIYCAPNQIYQKSGIGTNNLISQGANIYLNPSQLLLEDQEILMNIINKLDDSKENGNQGVDKKVKNKNMDIGDFSDLEKDVLNLLKEDIKTTDEIIEKISLSKKEVIEALSILELKGALSSLPGGRWKR